MTIEVVYADTGRVVSRFGEGTLGAGGFTEGLGTFVVGTGPDALGGEDFDSRSQANESNATIASDTR